MNYSKQVICIGRVRRVPAQFSWVDQRLVRDRHLDRLDVYAAALYLFLVTVADSQGLSWYGDASTARRLSMDEARLRRARDDLVRTGLLAYAGSLYQVLALDEPLPPVPRQIAALSVATPVSPATRVPVDEHLAALHAAIGRRT
jgi:hypothetical protein